MFVNCQHVPTSYPCLPTTYTMTGDTNKMIALALCDVPRTKLGYWLYSWIRLDYHGYQNEEWQRREQQEMTGRGLL